MRRVIGLIRLGHPFPSLLNAAASLAFAALAGAPLGVSIRLALSMLAIQVSIGALNDFVDSDRDAAEKSGKPIPSGLATRREAVVLAVVAGPLGLFLSVPSGIAVVALIAFGLVMGYVYDLRLSRTPLSWLPLSLALPIVPLHAWLGATGELPLAMAVLYPAAVVAGAGLAVANGLVDLERDARSGRPTIAVTLGFDRAWLAHAAALAAAAGAAIFLAPAPVGDLGASGPDVAASLRTWGLAIGILALLIGAVALRADRPALRERGWELEAVGVGTVAISWIAAIAATGS